MDTSLAAVVDLYVFPTGRRLFALTQVGQRAKALGFTELAKHCSAAITHDRQCLDLERRWAGSVARSQGKVEAPPDPEAPPGATKIDALVDRTLTAIRDHAESQAAGAPAGDPIHAMVASFLSELYPAGVQQVTSLPFVEELAAVDHILGLTRGKELAPVVEELGLQRLVKRLDGLAEQYRAALVAPAPEVLVFGQVRAARAEGQERLLQAVALVIGKHYRNTKADVAARAELLGPIVEQEAAIAVNMRSRRTVEDVDPDTGELESIAAAPADLLDPAADNDA